MKWSKLATTPPGLLTFFTNTKPNPLLSLYKTQNHHPIPNQALILQTTLSLSLSLSLSNTDMMNSGDETPINIPEPPRNHSKGKSVAAAAAPAAIIATTKATHHRRGGLKRGIAIFDFILRLCAIAAALAATATMGTTDQTLPFFTQFFQFQASYDDLPAFTFFVIANAIASGYLVLSLPFSIVSIVRPNASGPRLLLLILDTVMVALTTSAAAAATSIVYLAHNGNSSTNWIAICQQFNDFCQSTSGAVVASFIAAVIFMLLVVLSALALRTSKH